MKTTLWASSKYNSSKILQIIQFSNAAINPNYNSDDHYIYSCGQESLRRNGVALIVNKRSEMQYLDAISKMTE